MSRGKSGRPGQECGETGSVIRHTTLQPGKRPLTERVSVVGPTSAERAAKGLGAASTQRDMVGPGYGSPIPPVHEPVQDTSVDGPSGQLCELGDPLGHRGGAGNPYELYECWLNLWASRDTRAQSRLTELRDAIRRQDPADYADKLDMFRHGRRDALGPEHAVAADEADLCAAQLSVMADILQWLEAQEALRRAGKRSSPTLDEVNRKALEVAEAKAIYTNTLMTALLVGYPLGLAHRSVPSPSTHPPPAWRTKDAIANESRVAQPGATAAGPSQAAEAALRGPARRHWATSVDQHTVAKNVNTVIEPGIDVSADVAAIRAGQAARVDGYYVVNGRTYGVHDGTLYPIEGHGFHRLNRGAFQALGVLNKFGNTPQAHAILGRMKNVGPAEVESALTAWRASQ